MDFVKVKAHIGTARRKAEVTVTIPTRPVRPSRLTPMLRRMMDAAVDAASDGVAVTCSKGCGDCCSQMVPLRRMEARRLAAMVERMEEPRRTEILGRFAAARERLAAAAMLDAVERPREQGDLDWEEFALRYFHLGIPCPFLEDGSCSIYAERPLVCREFLVTSDPKHCRRPEDKLVDIVPVPSVGGAVRVIEREAQPEEDPWVLLVHALAWVAARPEESAGPVDAREFLRQVMEKLR
ncbi:MAG: YkgJ family cysteine cluster protein [Bryobacteraceae bacterium]